VHSRAFDPFIIKLPIDNNAFLVSFIPISLLLTIKK
jgi:hypothetical protein